MTFKHQYKAMIAVMVLLVQAFIANAQEEEKRNTGESIGKQFLNNRVPGLKYAPEKSKVQRKATVAEQQENHSESSGMQLKKGTIRGMRFTPGSTGMRNANMSQRTTVRRSAATGALSSDQKAGELKTAPATIAPAVPTQGEVTEPAATKEPTGNIPNTKKTAIKEVKKEQ